MTLLQLTTLILFFFVCACSRTGADENNSLRTRTPTLDECPAGGIVITTHDADHLICNGDDGTDGIDGVDANDGIITDFFCFGPIYSNTEDLNLQLQGALTGNGDIYLVSTVSSYSSNIVVYRDGIPTVNIVPSYDITLNTKGAAWVLHIVNDESYMIYWYPDEQKIAVKIESDPLEHTLTRLTCYYR